MTLLTKPLADQHGQPTPGTRLASPAEIGALIRERRKDMKLTQAGLAGISGVSHKFVNEVERGKATAEIGRIMAVLQMLGVDLYGRVR